MDSAAHGRPRIVVLASGQGTNFQAIIDASESGRLCGEVVGLISDNPDATALRRAKGHGIPRVVVERKSYRSKREFDLGLAEAVKRFSPDLVVLAGFMRLLGKDFLDEFPEKVINIHPSLLPAFRGLDAQKQALEYGVRYTGCTVHFVDEGTDTGPIIGQRVVPVMPDDTEDTLRARILVEEHALMIECINAVLAGKIRRNGRKVIIYGG
ncbi:MAG: phosphoribosylglycinamide formyltransferase [Firmicutes bacterium]|nr:phosphoribosylglycinamide formyltransferase [Bacillota bacterium]